METFTDSGVTIAFLQQGEGDPVLLIHGFASNATVNWQNTGWMSFLAENGFRAVALDNRGHGASTKFYESEFYAGPVMAGDSRRLLDHLGIARADVIGYSMGARLAAFLALDYPDRVRRAVFGGLGTNMMLGIGPPEPVANALLAEDPLTVTDPSARGFRSFADQTRSDRRALAACIRASRDRIPGEELKKIAVPILVAAGTEDMIAGPAKPLADAIPAARTLDLPGKDHMKAVGDPAFKQGVLAFLRQD